MAEGSEAARVAQRFAPAFHAVGSPRGQASRRGIARKHRTRVGSRCTQDKVALSC